MLLCCQICSTWTVGIAGSQAWTAPDGTEHDFVTGRCSTCQSVQLLDPSTFAVERMASLLRAAQHVAEVTADGSAGR
jgi:hypothetical protein